MGRFGGTGRHFWLDSWILANLVQLGTQRFCKQFLNRTSDPAGRQFDQMTQAARSGCANNAEGASRTATSKETEMRLTDVARASLAELQGDYLKGEKFQEEGGFREQLSVIRHEAMAKREQAPACPECGAVMRKRKAKSGKNAGQEFWGCSKFPACNGVRSL